AFPNSSQIHRANLSPSSAASLTISGILPLGELSTFSLSTVSTLLFSKPSFTILPIPTAEENVSRHPLFPQLHFAPSGKIVMCPTSPAIPSAPRQSFPSSIIPPPSPVPIARSTSEFTPSPAPFHNSPSAAQLASFS